MLALYRQTDECLSFPSLAQSSTRWSKHKSSRLRWVGGLAKAAGNPAHTSRCWTRTKPQRQSHWVSPAASPVWSRKSGMAARTFQQMFRVIQTHFAIYSFSSVPSLFCFFMSFNFWRNVQTSQETKISTVSYSNLTPDGKSTHFPYLSRRYTCVSDSAVNVLSQKLISTQK